MGVAVSNCSPSGQQELAHQLSVYSGSDSEVRVMGTIAHSPALPGTFLRAFLCGGSHSALCPSQLLWSLNRLLGPQLSARLCCWLAFLWPCCRKILLLRKHREEAAADFGVPCHLCEETKYWVEALSVSSPLNSTHSAKARGLTVIHSLPVV